MLLLRRTFLYRFSTSIWQFYTPLYTSPVTFMFHHPLLILPWANNITHINPCLQVLWKTEFTSRGKSLLLSLTPEGSQKAFGVWCRSLQCSWRNVEAHFRPQGHADALFYFLLFTQADRDEIKGFSFKAPTDTAATRNLVCGGNKQ